MIASLDIPNSQIVPVAGSGISKERLAALVVRDPDYRYRLYHSDITGANLGRVPRIEGAQVSLSNYRDHTWELSLPVREAERSGIDLFGGWVKAEVLLRDPFYKTPPLTWESNVTWESDVTWEGEEGFAERWLSFSLGLYRFDFPKGSDSPVERVYSLTGKSPEVLLLEDMAYGGYSVAAGAGVLATARGILLDRGIPANRIDFPPDSEDKLLANDVFFDPYQDAAGCYWLRIVNSLLAAGGFYALYADRDGRLTTHEIEDRLGAEDVFYGSWDTPDSEMMLTDDIGWEYSDEAFANRVVVYSGDPNEVTPVVGVAENNDPDSPISIPNIGVVQREPVTMQTLVSEAEADKVALAQLRLATSLHLKLNLATLPDPRRKPREVYRLEARKPDGTLFWDGTWRVTNWTLPLDRGQMSHEVSLNVTV